MNEIRKNYIDLQLYIALVTDQIPFIITDYLGQDAKKIGISVYT
jgi:hypothetical protein